MSTIQSRNVFYGINSRDSSDSILLEATSELGAKVELLDQLGFGVEGDQNGSFVMYDLEDAAIAKVLPATTSLEHALDICLKTFMWHVSEPVEMIGTTMPSGMGYDDEQNGW